MSKQYFDKNGNRISRAAWLLERLIPLQEMKQRTVDLTYAKAVALDDEGSADGNVLPSSTERRAFVQRGVANTATPEPPKGTPAPTRVIGNNSDKEQFIADFNARKRQKNAEGEKLQKRHNDLNAVSSASNDTEHIQPKDRFGRPLTNKQGEPVQKVPNLDRFAYMSMGTNPNAVDVENNKITKINVPKRAIGNYLSSATGHNTKGDYARNTVIRPRT